MLIGYYYIFKNKNILIKFGILSVRHYGRAVKAWDLKSHGETRAGSSPAGVELFFWKYNNLKNIG